MLNRSLRRMIKNDEGSSLTVKLSHKKIRLDQYLKDALTPFSRSQIQKWIRKGHITCDGQAATPAHLLRGGERISVFIPKDETSVVPESIPIDILYEDGSVMAINKPPGMLTHPAGKNLKGTLANAVSYHIQNKSKRNKEGLPVRAGIVHRLDKETSGVLIVAKDVVSMKKISDQFRARKIKKTYRAIVIGKMKMKTGEIKGSIGLDVRLRKMTIQSAGRASQTNFKVLKLFSNHTLLEICPKTGRTHQIRVHLSQIGYPILGDKIYGGDSKNVPRQMLHAHQIEFQHPATKKTMNLIAPIPKDFLDALKSLEP